MQEGLEKPGQWSETWGNVAQRCVPALLSQGSGTSLGSSLFVPRFQGVLESVRGRRLIFFPRTPVLPFSSAPLSLRSGVFTGGRAVDQIFKRCTKHESPAPRRRLSRCWLLNPNLHSLTLTLLCEPINVTVLVLRVFLVRPHQNVVWKDLQESFWVGSDLPSTERQRIWGESDTAGLHCWGGISAPWWGCAASRLRHLPALSTRALPTAQRAAGCTTDPGNLRYQVLYPPLSRWHLCVKTLPGFAKETLPQCFSPPFGLLAA